MHWNNLHAGKKSKTKSKSKSNSKLKLDLFRKAFGRSGTEFSAILGQSSQIKKKRKNRTAFTTFQLNELEKRFNYQKYLTPSDRDVIAEQLGLTSTQVQHIYIYVLHILTYYIQVITWFQNRRAKLKRDVDETNPRQIQTGNETGNNSDESDRSVTSGSPAQQTGSNITKPEMSLCPERSGDNHPIESSRDNRKRSGNSNLVIVSNSTKKTRL